MTDSPGRVAQQRAYQLMQCAIQGTLPDDVRRELSVQVIDELQIVQAYLVWWPRTVVQRCGYVQCWTVELLTDPSCPHDALIARVQHALRTTPTS